MNLLGVKTPHKLPILYIILVSKDLEDFKAILRKRCIDYTFLETELEFLYKRVQKSMPEALFFWHNQGHNREGLPPEKEAKEWCFNNGIQNFYEQLLLRDKDLVDKDFLKAWDVFGWNMTRLVLESLKLASVPHEDIFNVSEKIKAVVTSQSIDTYFREMFDLSDMDHVEVNDWLCRIEVWSHQYPSQFRDPLSKRHAFENPYDIWGTLAKCNARVYINRKDMLQNVELGLYEKIEDQLSFRNYDSQGSPGRLAALVSSLNQTIRMAEDSVSPMDDGDFKKRQEAVMQLGTETERILYATKLRSDKQLAGRGTLDAEVVDDEEKGKKN